MTNLHCQPDWIWNSLGDTPPGVSMKAFHEKFKTEQGRPILSVGDSKLDRLEWVGKCDRGPTFISVFSLAVDTV